MMDTESSRVPPFLDARSASTSQALTKDQKTALKGASLAFAGRPEPRPKPAIHVSTSGSAGRRGDQQRPVSRDRDTPVSAASASDGYRLGYQQSGGSNQGTGSYVRELERQRSGNGWQPSPEQSRSPSYIAATLAVSRSATPVSASRQQQSYPVLQRQASFSRSIRSVSSQESISRPTDTSSLRPTTSLIGLFEQNSQSHSASPKTKNKPKSKPNRPPIRRSLTTATERPSRIVEPLEPTPARARTPSPKKPKARKPAIKAKPTLTTSFPRPLLSSKPRSAPELPEKTAAKPIPIPRKSSPKLETNDDDASSDDSFVSASDYKPSWRATLHEQNRKRRFTSSSVNSAVTIDSLANAIVASSLASSRAASPSKSHNSMLPPAPPPTRRSQHKHLFHHHKDASRESSPVKHGTLRTTMRKPKTDDEPDEGDKRRSRKTHHLMKKHPHKHHEGDRKRWRDSITERERKRYEAVWASNRGLHVGDAPGAADCVSSLVARDIFSRSRLHDDVLEEVYGLVDRRQDGLLERNEFVVGLWLIDQRLKGRKLPIRVSDSVWRSVGALGGIKVRKVGK